MAEDDVREAAKALIRRQVWESNRGKATRAYLKAHPELVVEFTHTGTITNAGLDDCSDCRGGGAVSESSRGSDGPDKCGSCGGTGKIVLIEFPEHVTRASVLLELNTRARRNESSIAAKKWREEHPEEAAKLREEVLQESEETRG